MEIGKIICNSLVEFPHLFLKASVDKFLWNLYIRIRNMQGGGQVFLNFREKSLGAE
jgi:hypothetical protein